MKARQLSVSFASVYALGLLDQVRLIRRGPDGFWGPWEATGVNAKRLVHAGTVVAVIGLDDRVAVYDQLPGRVRHAWDFQASELRVAPLPRGGAVLFALSAGRVWWAWKPSVLGPWSEWEPLGGPAEKLAAAAIPRHGTTVCYAHDGVVYCHGQSEPTLEWSPWESLGGPGGGVEDLALTVAGTGGTRPVRPGPGRSRLPPLAGSPGLSLARLGVLGRAGPKSVGGPNGVGRARALRDRARRSGGSAPSESAVRAMDAVAGPAWRRPRGAGPAELHRRTRGLRPRHRRRDSPRLVRAGGNAVDRVAAARPGSRRLSTWAEPGGPRLVPGGMS
jgi:hypothetical protein